MDSEQLRGRDSVSTIESILRMVDDLDPKNPFLQAHTVEGFFWRALMSSKELVEFIFSLNNRFVNPVSREAHRPNLADIAEVLSTLVEQREVTEKESRMLHLMFHCAIFSGYREGMPAVMHHHYPDLRAIPLPFDCGESGLQGPYEYVTRVPRPVPMTRAKEYIMLRLEAFINEALRNNQAEDNKEEAQADRESGSDDRQAVAQSSQSAPSLRSVDLLRRRSVYTDEHLKKFAKLSKT